MGRFIFLLLLVHCHLPSARKQIFGLRDHGGPVAEGNVEFLAGPPGRRAYQDAVYDSDLAQSHMVKELPGMPFGYSHAMYAGDISVMEPTLKNNGSLFYWHFESQGNPGQDPLVIWINGGPGCSGMEGALIEHGPFLAVSSGFALELNDFSWNKHANVLYLDQPVGTGYAVVQDGAYAHSQEEVNIMFISFLKRWMQVHPRFKDRPLYLAGESYAGRYIPHFAHQMLASGYNLQGVAIGNGWTHPLAQSEILPDYSLNLGLISADQKVLMDKMVVDCRAKWDVNPYSPETYEVCEKIQNYVPHISGRHNVGRVNEFDVRSYDPNAGKAWPWRVTGEKEYLNLKSVREALHVDSRMEWHECSSEVEKYLTHEDMYPTVRELQELLPLIRVLLYNGQFDWICNHVGVERYLNDMDFSGKEHFVDPAQRGLWVSGSRLAGYVKSGGNLTFLIVLGGSHMVPIDKRPETKDMLERFLRGDTYSDLTGGDDVKPAVTPVNLLENSVHFTQNLGLLTTRATSAIDLDGHSLPGGSSRFDLSSLALISFGIALGLFINPLMGRLCGRLVAKQGGSSGYRLITSS